ncbi:MAG: lactonase family protein, partial [Anaerolineae bacterium]|nr:lactonase family protein [Anaerolineae bacterium]
MNTKLKYLLYVGTYSPMELDSIYIYQMDSMTGELEFHKGVKGGENPSYLLLSPDGRFLYAVNQLVEFQGRPSGAVSAFAIEPLTGELTFLNQQPSHGSGPCHLTLDRSGQFLLVANYLGGNLAIFPLSKDGRIEAASQVVQHRGKGRRKEQDGPHAHFIAAVPSNRFVLSCDLGVDKVIVYQFDTVNGNLLLNSEAMLPSGSGPRHLDFHPDGRYVYLVNELNSTMTVLTFNDKTGV